MHLTPADHRRISCTRFGTRGMIGRIKRRCQIATLSKLSTLWSGCSRACSRCAARVATLRMLTTFPCSRTMLQPVSIKFCWQSKLASSTPSKWRSALPRSFNWNTPTILSTRCTFCSNSRRDTTKRTRHTITCLSHSQHSPSFRRACVTNRHRHRHLRRPHITPMTILWTFKKPLHTDSS